MLSGFSIWKYAALRVPKKLSIVSLSKQFGELPIHHINELLPWNWNTAQQAAAEQHQAD